MILNAVWKGFVSYLDSLKIQEDLKKLCLEQRRDFAAGFECPATVTLGLRGEDKDLLLSKEEFAQKNIPIVPIQRGGQATLHSPGQLVVYPVVNIQKNKMRVRDFIVYIENVTKSVLESLGIKVHKEEGQAGLFTQKGKIAFFGLHVANGISQHGLAVNVKNDLSLFSYIRSCGAANRLHDRVQDYCPWITVKDFFDLWIQKALSE